jgi:NADH:ubiquinone oxidoreductase subunit E
VRIVIRVELCTDHLRPEDRESILEAIYEELHISPGQVSSDGNFELALSDCREQDANGAPYLRIDGNLFARVTAGRARDLVRARRRR